MLGPDRSRLSKRHGAKSMTEYITEGYLPEAMVNYLARLGWSHGDQEIFSMAELIEKFDIADVGKSAGVFNPEKLEWLNAHYIKESDPKALAERLLPFVESRGWGRPDAGQVSRAAATLKERSKTLVEMAEMGAFYFADEIEYDPKAAEKFLTQDVERPFAALAERFGTLDPWELCRHRGGVYRRAGGARADAREARPAAEGGAHREDRQPRDIRGHRGDREGPGDPADREGGRLYRGQGEVYGARKRPADRPALKLADSWCLPLL